MHKNQALDIYLAKDTHSQTDMPLQLNFNSENQLWLDQKIAISDDSSNITISGTTEKSFESAWS